MESTASRQPDGGAAAKTAKAVADPALRPTDEERPAPTSRSSDPIFDTSGGPDPVIVRRFHEHERDLVERIVMLLRVACGSVTQGVYGGWRLVEDRSRWRSLRDLDRSENPKALAAAEALERALQ
jgi:hypothetical protein